MPPPPIPRDRPAPVLTTVSYGVGLAVMGWALWRGREVHFPGDGVVSLAVPAFLALGATGTIFFGVGFAMLGHSRGEPKALRALWLVPVLAVAIAVLGGLAWFFGFL